jgi:hypothetical protein
VRVKAWRIILVLLFIGFGVMVWWGLAGLEPQARWLQVNAPPAGRIGQPFPVRVRLGPVREARFLTADLHWGKSHDRSELYLDTGGSRAVDPTGGIYDFAVPVPPRPGLRYVQVVIYLSRDGNWNTSTRVATSDFFEVTEGPTAALETQSIPRRMTDGTPGSFLQRPAGWPHVLTGLVFVLAAALAWFKGGPILRPGSNPIGEVACWRIPAWCLSLAAVWELTAMPARIDRVLREAAHRQDLYYLRGAVQKLAISLVLPAAVWLLWQARRVPANHRLFFAVFSLYITLTAVDLVSLHAVDQVLERSWQGITVSQALGLGFATLLLQQALVKPRS